MELVSLGGSLTSAIGFVLGAIVGSFLNVLILRYNTGRSLAGRSGCLSCGKALTWRELFPVLSFFIQKGRCLKCKSKISWQYPMVELVTGIIFALIISKSKFQISNIVQIANILFYWTIFSLLIIITAYDIRHKIIPDGMVFGLITLALLKLIAESAIGFEFRPLFSFVLAGAGMFLFFAALWYFSGGRWMGFGDAKLALGLGFLLGPSASAAALALSFWMGAITGLALLFLKSGRYTMKSEVPFAPFLVLAAFIVYIFNINTFDFMNWHNFLPK